MSVRLLDVPSTAAYLSLSSRYVRLLVTHGDLIPVRVGRRVLFDREDLDRLIDKWKSQSSGQPNVQLSAAALKGWRQTPVRRKKGEAA